MFYGFALQHGTAKPYQTSLWALPGPGALPLASSVAMNCSTGLLLGARSCKQALCPGQDAHLHVAPAPWHVLLASYMATLWDATPTGMHISIAHGNKETSENSLVCFPESDSEFSQPHLILLQWHVGGSKQRLKGHRQRRWAGSTVSGASDSITRPSWILWPLNPVCVPQL